MGIASRALTIERSNVKSYMTADDITLDSSYSGDDVALRSSAKTGYAIFNDAAKTVLFPNATAKPIKADSFVKCGSSTSNSNNYCELQFDGTAVHKVLCSQKTDTASNLTNAAITGATKASTIRYKLNINNLFVIGVVHTMTLTLYFNEYALSATAVDGVRTATVSKNTAYDGDSVTFSAELYSGAAWDGWYSDAACTNLVSTSQSYTVSPTADMTLYAKATLSATMYDCSAVAGTEIASASVSSDKIAEGESCTFTAAVNEGCDFNGWYSDAGYTALVSSSNPYTATINASTTLYAKATRRQVTLAVGTAEHGTAMVSAQTVPYGTNVTYTFTPQDETWELYGWYSDAGLTQLVSEANPYTFAAKADTTLYPKTGKKLYTISFGNDRDAWNGVRISIEAIAVRFEQLTRDEINCLRTGDYDSIDPSKIIDRKSASGSYVTSDVYLSIECPCDAYVALFAKPAVGLNNYAFYILDANGAAITYWPYYWYQPTADATFHTDHETDSSSNWCDCSAVTGNGVTYAYATTPTLMGQNAIFEAEVSSGYEFTGWYSDAACTNLVSADNPAYVTTSAATLTLYAKATATGVTGTGVYIKRSGAWQEAQNVYKKVNGAWVQQTDMDAVRSQLQSGNYKTV